MVERRQLIPLCLLLAVPLAGATDGPPPVPASRAYAQPMRASGTADGAGLDAMVDAALADAARRTGERVDALTVVSAETVVWPDGGLGCPHPGVRYTMALVDGYRIQLRAGDRVLDYHAGRQGQLLLCPLGQARPLPPDGRN